MLEKSTPSQSKLLILRALEEYSLRETLTLIAVFFVFFFCSTDLPLDLVDGEAKNILNSPVELCCSSCVHESPM